MAGGRWKIQPGVESKPFKQRSLQDSMKAQVQDDKAHFEHFDI